MNMGKQKKAAAGNGSTGNAEQVENLEQYLTRRLNELRTEYTEQGRAWPPDSAELTRLRERWLMERSDGAANADEADAIIQQQIDGSIEATERRVHALEQSIMQERLRRGRRLRQRNQPPRFLIGQPVGVLRIPQGASRPQFVREPARVRMYRPGQPAAVATRGRGVAVRMTRHNINPQRAAFPQVTDPLTQGRLQRADTRLAAAQARFREVRESDQSNDEIREARKELTDALDEAALAQGLQNPNTALQQALSAGELQQRQASARREVQDEENTLQQLERQHTDDSEHRDIVDTRARLQRARQYLAHITSQCEDGALADLSDGARHVLQQRRGERARPTVEERFASLRTRAADLRARVNELDEARDNPPPAHAPALLIELPQLRDANATLSQQRKPESTKTVDDDSTKPAEGKSKDKQSIEEEEREGDHAAAPPVLTHDQMQSRFYSARALVAYEQNRLRDLEREYPNDLEQSEITDAHARLQTASRYQNHIRALMEAAGFEIHIPVEDGPPPMSGRRARRRAVVDWPGMFIRVQSEVQAADDALQRLKFRHPDKYDGPEMEAAQERVDKARQTRNDLGSALIGAAMQRSARTGHTPAGEDDWFGRYSRLSKELDKAYAALRKLLIRFPKGDAGNPDIADAERNAARARDDMSNFLLEVHRAAGGRDEDPVHIQTSAQGVDNRARQQKQITRSQAASTAVSPQKTTEPSRKRKASIGGGEKKSKRLPKSPVSPKTSPSKPAEKITSDARLDREAQGTTPPVANHPVLVLRPKSGKAKTVKGVKSKLSQRSAVAASDVFERRDRSAEQDEAEKQQGKCFYLYG